MKESASSKGLIRLKKGKILNPDNYCKSQLMDAVLRQSEVIMLLEKSISYSRQFYHLPQAVYDLFYKVHPSTKYDNEITGRFYNEIMEDNYKQVVMMKTSKIYASDE